jgi:LCP family protein required for cell wall assembly
MTDRPRARNGALAGFLSFLFPGLGQAYAREPRWALVFGVPILVLLIGAVVSWIALDATLEASLLSPVFLAGVVVADLALMAWRVAAILHAGILRPSRPRSIGALHRAVSFLIVLLLVVGTVEMHVWTAGLIGQFNTTLNDVFQPGLAGPGGGGPLNKPEYRWNGRERINFLLLGIDAAPGRPEALTDTILVLSIDPAAHTAAMVSVPRDTGFVPLPDRSVYRGGVYPYKINQLATVANRKPAIWCPDLPADTTQCGLRTLERAISLYVGVPIEYYATIDLAGFTQLIDALGGVRLCLDSKVVDPEYSGGGWGGRGLVLEPGCSQYDGPHALAYARSRKGYLVHADGSQEVQTDYIRADRQQLLLLALREKFAKVDLFLALPQVLKAISATVNTDFPRALAGDLASLLPLMADPSISRVVLGYPQYLDPPLQPQVYYLNVPRRDQIRAAMLQLFGTVEGWYLATTATRPPA